MRSQIHRLARRFRVLFKLLILVSVITITSLGICGDETGGRTQSINLSQTLSRVMRDSPKLSAYPYDLRIAEARKIQAGFRPNPELSLEFENIVGDNEFKGIDSAEITLALSQVIELGGKRHRRKNVAHFDKALLQQDYQITRLDVLSEAANRFLDVVQVQRQLQLIQLAAQWALQAEQVVQRRFKAGSANRAELSQARIETIRAKLAVTNLQSTLESRKRQLAALWNSEQVSFTEVQAELFQLSNVASYSDLRIRLNHAPQLRRYLTLDRLRQAELELALSQRRQNIDIGLGVKRFEATGDHALTLQFSMPIGIGNKNQGGIEESRASLERLGQEQAASRLFLQTELFRLYQNMQQAQQTVRVLHEQALPEAKQALTQTRQGYRKGRFSYLELVETQRLRLTVELDAINVAVDFHRALLMLEKLTGESLTQAPRSIIKTGTTKKLIQD